MGVYVKIGSDPGEIHQVVEYTVNEDSTPLSSDDSGGSVGEVNFTLKGVDEPALLEGEFIELYDNFRGTVTGNIIQVTETDHGTSQYSCQLRTGKLNIYGVQAQPFIGTLGDAFEYYCNLSGADLIITTDPQIRNRPVVFPGWEGELWYYMKQMASAQECEIALVEGVVTLRPLRTRVATDELHTSKTRTYGGHTLARAVEVYSYNNREINDELVYPPGGWQPETEIITVNAGETAERVLELSASVSRIEEPEMLTFVGQQHNDSSVYTIVGDDGFPVEPAQWRDAGGRLEVTINEDTTSLTVTVRGATGIRSTKGESISTFSVALGSDVTGNRYSTLRIVGDGVAFDKELLTIRTLIPDEKTGTEVGVTIDNPFLSAKNDAYKAGVRAAHRYAGEEMAITGDATNLHFQYEAGASDDEKVFGNAGGARYWDRKSRRWYRNRSSGINRATFSIDAENDLTWGDVELYYDGYTWGEVQEFFTGLTYSKRERRGLYLKDYSELPGDAFPSPGLFPSTDLFPQGV